jgi:hypothetical protein
LKVIVYVLHLVSFVLIEIVFDLLSVDVMELTNLVQSVCGYALESLAVLLLGQETKLVVEVSNEV